MTYRNSRLFIMLFAASGLLSAGVAGCSKDEAPQPVVRKTVPREQSKPAEEGKVAEPQASRQPAVALYNAAGKRDPFEPFLKVETRDVRAGMENVPPLQRYDLGELKFVGVIWGPKEAFALVEDAEGKGYTVTVGTRIGRGGGVVTKVLEGEILIKEEFRDLAGAKVVRRSSMKLHSAGGK